MSDEWTKKELHAIIAELRKDLAAEREYSYRLYAMALQMVRYGQTEAP